MITNKDFLIRDFFHVISPIEYLFKLPRRHCQSYSLAMNNFNFSTMNNPTLNVFRQRSSVPIYNQICHTNSTAKEAPNLTPAIRFILSKS